MTFSPSTPPATAAGASIARRISLTGSTLAQFLGAFDTASKQIAERPHNNLAEGFAKEFALAESSGEPRGWGEGLNNNLSRVDKFYSSTGAVATILARKGDDFVRISTSL